MKYVWLSALSTALFFVAAVVAAFTEQLGFAVVDILLFAQQVALTFDEYDRALYLHARKMIMSKF